MLNQVNEDKSSSAFILQQDLLKVYRQRCYKMFVILRVNVVVWWLILKCSLGEKTDLILCI